MFEPLSYHNESMGFIKKRTPTNNKYNKIPDDEGWVLAHFNYCDLPKLLQGISV